MSRKDLLQYAFDQEVTPTSSNFKKVCSEWLATRFPDVEDERLKEGLKTFVTATKKKWKDVDADQVSLFGSPSQKHQDWLDSEFKDSDFVAVVPKINIKKEKNHDSFFDEPQPCHTCGHYEGADSGSGKRTRKQPKRLQYNDNDDFFSNSGPPEEAVAEMLKTHASDDAAFVFEELMQNPMEVGKEVAGFLRRRKARKMAGDSKGAGAGFPGGNLSNQGVSSVTLPGASPLTITPASDGSKRLPLLI